MTIVEAICFLCIVAVQIRTTIVIEKICDKIRKIEDKL